MHDSASHIRNPDPVLPIHGDRVKYLFTAGTLTFIAVGAAMTLSLITFRFPLADFLGAEGTLIPLLTDYMLGYSFGITGQILCSLFMTLLPLNNRSKLSYTSIFVMIFVNTAFDIIFISYYSMGCFGLGLASSLSYILSALVLLSGFFGKDKVLVLDPSRISFKDFPEAAKLGLPVLCFNIGVTLKSYIINNTLMFYIGPSAVAVLNLQGSLCSLLGSVPVGCAVALLILGSIYYGEENREALIGCMKYTIKTGIILCAIIAALLVFGAPYLSSMFFSPADEAYALSIRMLYIFPIFLVFNLVLSVIIKGFTIVNKMALANTMTFAEQIITAIVAAGMTHFMGTEGVWWSFSLASIICLLIIGIYVFKRAGMFTFKAEDWMLIEKEFGAQKGDYIEMSLTSMDEVIGMSETVIDFCINKGISPKKSMLAGLAIEEMAGNIVQHGFVPGKKHLIEVRVVKKENLIIRIKDNCREFDPKKRIDQFYPEDICKNIGIRMIAGIAKSMEYQNNIGINTLLITI